MKRTIAFVTFVGIALSPICTSATAADAKFGPSNPFYAPSTLPFHAPPFDKIKDEDYQPAIEAGMVEELTEIQAIADNPAAPTFENTLVAMEKSGRLLKRVMETFEAVSGANTNPVLQNVRAEEAPKLAAHYDAIYLNAKLFARVTAVYKQRESLNLDPESLRLVEVTYDKFVRSGGKSVGCRESRIEETERGDLDTLDCFFEEAFGRYERRGVLHNG